MKFGPATVTWANLSSPTAITSGETPVYNCWPWGVGFYDAARDQLVQAYTSGSVHAEAAPADFDKIARIVRKANASASESFSAPVTVYSEASTSCPIHGLCLLANGDYIAIVSTLTSPDFFGADTPAHVCKSTDGGATWTNWKLVDGATAEINSSWTVGLRRLSSGRLLAWAAYNHGGQTFTGNYRLQPIYSDDSGVTWARGGQINRGPATIAAGYAPWEPCVIELADGRLVVLLCSSVGGGELPMLACKSEDGGETWTPCVQTSLMTTSNPAASASIGGGHAIVFGSRATGQPGLYATWASDDMLWNLRFQRPVFLVSGTASSDFGYPSLIASGSKVWCYYYNGSAARADVYELRGTIA